MTKRVRFADGQPLLCDQVVISQINRNGRYAGAGPCLISIATDGFVKQRNNYSSDGNYISGNEKF
ncbi:hypothetical protein [Spirosoma arcticum]